MTAGAVILSGFAAISGQDRGVISQRITVFFDGVVYRHIGCAVQRGGKGAVDGHLQRMVGGQVDVLGGNICLGACRGNWLP